MDGMSEDDRLLRNLKDAGCDETTIDRYFRLRKEGRVKEQYRLLSMQRALLLDQVHISQRMVDCLDYLIYEMKKEEDIYGNRQEGQTQRERSLTG